MIESYSALFQQTIIKCILAFDLDETKFGLLDKTVKLPPMFQMRNMNSVGQNTRLKARYIHSRNAPPPKGSGHNTTTIAQNWFWNPRGNHSETTRLHLHHTSKQINKSIDEHGEESTTGKQETSILQVVGHLQTEDRAEQQASSHLRPIPSSTQPAT